MINFKFVSVLFCSFLLHLPLQISSNCTPFSYSFLQTKIVQQPSQIAPYFIPFQSVLARFKQGEKTHRKTNLEEWRERLCDDLVLEEMERIVYKMPIGQLKQLKTNIGSKKMALPVNLRQNSLAVHLKQYRCMETMDYFIFAKQCEPHVIRTSGWKTPQRDTIRMQALIDVGLKKFKRTKSNYVKLRYAYQLVRLAHYRKNYAQTLELYDYLLPKTDPTESIVNDWLLGHRAGALLQLGERTKANYLYLQIFQRSSGKRESAYQSFKVKTDEEWRAVELMCETDRERAALYALRAMKPKSNIQDELDAIYKLDPQSPYLELLLVRKMQEVEKNLLGRSFNDQRRLNKRRFGIPRPKAGPDVIELQRFARKCANESQVEHPALWKFAEGYLEFLAGDLYAASRTFDQAQKMVDHPDLQEQIAASKIALEIDGWEEMNTQTEARAYELITEDTLYQKYKDFPDFLFDKMTYLYGQQGRPGLAFRMKHTLRELKPNPQLDIIDDLLLLLDKKELSPFEAAIVRDKSGAQIRSDLLHMKGDLLFSQGKPEAALKTYKLIPLEELDNEVYNPFQQVLFDRCIHCPRTDTIFYNKVELIEHIFDQEYRARADLERGAFRYYRLGNGMYNLSYFGYDWSLMDDYRSGVNWYEDKDRIYPLKWAIYGNREMMDLSKALEYYDQAIALSRNPELTARAAYMAAQCQVNMYLISSEKDFRRSDDIPVFPPEYTKYYKMLRDDLSETEFYQEVIRECKFFQAYL